MTQRSPYPLLLDEDSALLAAATNLHSCAVADCLRAASKTVLVEGVNGHRLDEPLPVMVCLPCFAYYGLVAVSEVRDA